MRRLFLLIPLVFVFLSCGGGKVGQPQPLASEGEEGSQAVDSSKETHNLTCHYEPNTGNVGGRVTNNQTGRGIGGATVQILYLPLCATWSKTTTDANGNYQLRGVPAGKTYTFEASASGYQSSQKSLAVRVASHQLDFSLTPTLNKATYISETYKEPGPQDGYDFSPNQSFTKTWTFRNDGTTVWNSNYYLKFAGTNFNGKLSLNQNNRPIQGSISPGQTYTFRVDMRSPASGTGLKETWEFKSPGGSTITPMWALIDVDTCQFGGATLTVTTPNGGENWERGNQYTIRWNKAGNVSAVRIHLYKGGSFSRTIAANTSNTGSYSYSIPKEVVAGGDYKVAMSNVHNDPSCDGKIYDFSNNNFTISDPPPFPAPNLRSPTDNALNVSPTTRLSWQDVQGATAYRVQVATDNGFNNLVVDQGISGSPLPAFYDVPQGRLSYGTVYYWRVRAGSDFAGGYWSNVWRFTTVAAPKPNLVPFQPGGWSGIIVASDVGGTNVTTSLSECKTTYIDWAIWNKGGGDATTTFYTDLYIDGVKANSWFTDGLTAGSRAYVQDWTRSFSAGKHALKIVTDSTGVIDEGSNANENDNSFETTFTWNACNTCPDGTQRDNVGDPCIHNDCSDRSLRDGVGDPCNHNDCSDRSLQDGIGDPCVHNDCQDRSPMDPEGDPCNHNDCSDRSPQDTIGDPCNHDEDNDQLPDEKDAAPLNPKASIPERSTYYGNNQPNVSNVSDPVNTASGNYAYHHTDLRTVGGRGLGLNFTRTCNNQDSYKGPLGIGWTHAYNIFATELPDRSVVIKWGDGHTEHFVPDGNGGYLPPAGVFSSLIQQMNGGFLLTTKDKTVFRFSKEGLLTDIADRKGNKLNLVYDGQNRLSRISDEVSRSLRFYYLGNNPSQMTAAEGPGGRWVRFAYTDDDLTGFTDVRGKLTQYRYDGLHQMTEVVDPRTNSLVTNRYDNYRRVFEQLDARKNLTKIAYDTPATGETTVTDPLDQTTRQVYDEYLRVKDSYDPAGKAIRYEYNGDNLRTAVVDRNGSRLESTYDPRGNLKTLKDPLSAVTTFDYDPNTDDLLKVTFPSGHVRNFEYDGEGNLRRVWEMVDGQRVETTSTFDDWGRVKEITDPEGGKTIFAYNQFNDPGESLESITDAEGGVTRFFFDSSGRLSVLTDPMNRVTRYNYYPDDQIETATDPAGKAVAFTYDPNGNLEKTVDRNGNPTEFFWNENDFIESIKNALGAEQGFTYDPLNRIKTITDPENRTLTYTYHPTGEPETLVDPMGRKQEFRYDPEGNPTTLIDPAGKSWIYRPDKLGRIESAKDPLGNETLYEYEPLLGTLKKVTDAEGRVTEFKYYQNGWLKSVIDPLVQTTSFEYYKTGTLKTLTNAAGKQTTFTYDKTGRLKVQTNALGQQEQYFYDLAGSLSRFIDGRRQETQYNYDPQRGLLSSIQFVADGTSVSYTYDPNGNRWSRTDPSGKTDYTYDPLDRLETLKDTRGFDIRYGYDRSGLLTGLTYPGAKPVTYGYNKAGQLETVTDWLNNALTYSYDAAGRLGGAGYPNSFKTSYGYDDASRLVSLVNKKADASVLSSYLFTLNKIGNRTQVQREEPLAPDLSAEETPSTYNEENELLTLGNLILDYDDNGNLALVTAGNDVTDYLFDARDLLTKITTPDQKTTEFGYDGDGNRISLTKDGAKTQFVVDPNRSLTDVIAEADKDGTIQDYYIHGLGLAAKVSADGKTVRYYHYDPIGSTVALSDPAGSVTDTYAYDEFGRVLGRTGNTPNPFQYVGQLGVQGDPTGLHYMRARYYDPTAGRFISRDPIGFAGGMNLYGYAGNDPVRYVDPSGHFLDTLLDAAFLLYDVGTLAYDEIFNEGKNRQENLTALTIDAALTLIPFATGGGAIYRTAAHAEDIGRVSEKAITHLDDLTRATEAAGKNVNKIGKAGEDFLHTIVQGKLQKPFLDGARRVDEVSGKILYESKNTYVSQTTKIMGQVEKDTKLVKQGYQPAWQLWQGGSKELKTTLHQRGITYVDYAQKSSNIGLPRLVKPARLPIQNPLHGGGEFYRILNRLTNSDDLSGKASNGRY